MIKNFATNIKLPILLLLSLMLNNCTGSLDESNGENQSSINTQKKHITASKKHSAADEYSSSISNSRFVVGKSYKIKGSEQKYHPKIDIKYDEVGYALWYASSFHGRQTASGPDYNENMFTAAHRTLPLPSVVKVTNLENGKEIIVVVNDRGPFLCSKKAIIDLSKSAAEEIDIIEKGKARVRLQYLHEETKKLHSKLPERHRKRASIALSASEKQIASAR